MSKTIFVSIGNSDDKLTQAEWAHYAECIDTTVRIYAGEIYGAWYSAPQSEYQNACWAFSLVQENLKDEFEAQVLMQGRRFRQDTVAWAEAETELKECGTGVDDAVPV